MAKTLQKFPKNLKTIFGLIYLVIGYVEKACY